MIDPIDHKHSGYSFFGQDFFTIPCFRDSCLYGFSAAAGTSLLTFLLTSNGMKSFNFAFGALALTTVPYMIYCQEQHFTTMNRFREVEERVKIKTNNDLRISDSLDDDLIPDAVV